jgi:hypothetical protein
MKRFMRACCAVVLAGSVAFAADDAISNFLAFFDKVADAAVADKDDCATMAKDINKLIDDNKAVLDAAKKAQASGKALPADARNHMMATGKRMAAAVAEKCKDDKGVTAAMARLPKHGPPARH